MCICDVAMAMSRPHGNGNASSTRVTLREGQNLPLVRVRFCSTAYASTSAHKHRPVCAETALQLLSGMSATWDCSSHRLPILASPFSHCSNRHHEVLAGLVTGTASGGVSTAHLRQLFCMCLCICPSSIPWSPQLGFQDQVM